MAKQLFRLPANLTGDTHPSFVTSRAIPFSQGLFSQGHEGLPSAAATTGHAQVVRRPIAPTLRSTAGSAVRLCMHWHIHPDTISSCSIGASALAAIGLGQKRFEMHSALSDTTPSDAVQVGAIDQPTQGRQPARPVLVDVVERRARINPPAARRWAPCACRRHCVRSWPYMLEVLRSSPCTMSALLRDRAIQHIEAGRRLAAALGVRSVTYEAGDAFDRQSLTAIRPRPTIVVASGLYELFPENDRVLKFKSGLPAEADPFAEQADTSKRPT